MLRTPRLHALSPYALAILLCSALAGCMHVSGELRTPQPPAGDAYVEALVARARAAQLARDPGWLKLVHYRLGMFGPGYHGGGYESEADGEGFFLSPRGKGDPEAELEATLRALFMPLSAVGANRFQRKHEEPQRKAIRSKELFD